MNRKLFRPNIFPFVMIVFFAFGFSGGLPENSSVMSPQENPLVLLTSIEVGGRPDSIVVDLSSGRNDIAFYDLSTAKLRFLDGDTLAMAPEEIYLPNWDFDSWLQYDRYFHRIYVVTVRTKTGWWEAVASVIQDRAVLTGFSINAVYNEGMPDPPDDKYSIEGFTLEQPLTEGSNPARLIVDNTYTGIVDFVDLDAAGTNVARRQRASYRDPLTSPSWQSDDGNSLALETNHETLGIDDLTTTDVLYISDPNHEYVGGYGYIRRMSIGHPTQDLNATLLSELNLNATWPFMNQGLDELEMAGPRDRLYLASNMQSFNTGYMGRINTTNNALNVVNLTYGDPGFLTIDWFDTNRIFVTTFDGFYNDPYQGLYLHLVNDQTVVYTLKLMDNYDEINREIRDLVFDPYLRRLYLTVGTKIMVVKVNYGSSVPFPWAVPQAYLPIIKH